LLYAVQDLGVVEIAHSDTNHPRRVCVALLDEHEQRAAGPTASSCTANCRAAATTTATATATAEAPTG